MFITRMKTQSEFDLIRYLYLSNPFYILWVLYLTYEISAAMFQLTSNDILSYFSGLVVLLLLIFVFPQYLVDILTDIVHEPYAGPRVGRIYIGILLSAFICSFFTGSASDAVFVSSMLLVMCFPSYEINEEERPLSPEVDIV